LPNASGSSQLARNLIRKQERKIARMEISLDRALLLLGLAARRWL
jgi:hypothetical protein